MLSKTGEAEDIGKIFALLASFEALGPMVFVIIMTTVYNATLDKFPGAVFLFMASIYVLNMVLLLYVFVLLKRGIERVVEEVLEAPLVQDESNESNDHCDNNSSLQDADNSSTISS